MNNRFIFTYSVYVPTQNSVIYRLSAFNFRMMVMIVLPVYIHIKYINE